MSTTSNSRTNPVTGSSTTSMTSRDATAPNTTTTSTTSNTNTNTGYNNSTSNIGSSRYGSSDVSATADPASVYDTSGRAGNIDLTSGRAGATRVALGSQDNIPPDSNYGTATGYGYGRAAPGVTGSEYSSTLGTGTGTGRGMGSGMGTATGTGTGIGANTAYSSNVNQAPLDAAVQTRPDGSLNTDSIYGSKSAAQTQMGSGAFRPGMTSGSNTYTSGDYADTADTAGAANTSAPYRAVPTTGPFMAAADGTATGTGTMAAPGSGNIPTLGTGHTMVATDMPSSQIIGGAGAINSTTTTTAAGRGGVGMAPGSAGRVLMVLSSATPAIYGASLMHPSTLFSGQKRKSGYFWDEVAIPYQTFTDAGYSVDFCSETGSAAVDEMSLESSRLLPQGKSIWNDKRHPIHSQLQSNILSAGQIDPSRYNIVFFAGGHAAAYDLPTATNVQRVAASVYEQGGVIAAVCHGTAVFKGLRLSNGEFLARGRRLTGFSAKGEEKMGMMDQLRSDNVSTIPDIVNAAGGQWQEHESDPMAEYVIDDGRIVTGMNPASAGPVANKAIQIDRANSNRNTGPDTGTSVGAYQTQSGMPAPHHHHQHHHNRAGFSSTGTGTGIDSGYDKTTASASQTDLPRDQNTYSNTSRIA